MTARKRLPHRRESTSFDFIHGDWRYHATASWFASGALAEIFLDGAKVGSAIQQQAETTAVLASLLLQHHVPVEVIVHAVRGTPVAAALELAVLS